jgi:glycosyltransferase involved in cell wall biosynthesis
MVSAKVNRPLVVVGKPTAYKSLADKYIGKHSDLLNVIFLSGIQDRDLAILYQMADMMVYPSRFEGFGLPVAEAQASGCPVITSNVSSLPEAGGDAAIYINPEKPEEIGNAINMLLDDERLIESLILGGKSNARRFTPASFSQQLKQLYNKILND